jgi:cell division septation protein DedD
MFQKIIFVIGAFVAPFLYADTLPKLSSFASSYADKFIQTASGETYNPSQYTASFMDLPFHTLVRVTNSSNGLSVIVRINDRPENQKSNQIDLSKTAAMKIDLPKKGSTQVEIEVLGVSQFGINPSQRKINEVAKIDMPSSRPSVEKKPLQAMETGIIPPTNLSAVLQNGFTPTENVRFSDLTRKKVFPKGYGIQIGAFMNDENAFRYGEWASKKGFSAIYIENTKTNGLNIFRVIVGEYKNEEEADSKILELARAGFSSAVLYSFTDN